MTKLAKLVESMPYEDLVKLQKDLHAGNLDRLIAKRLEDIRPTKTRLCPVCNNDVDQNHNLTLVFGPPELRQKASFDGPDCLIYFLDQLRRQG
ncbi:hypothetical protein JXA12_05030 [Candidatus Woesearchaeota archaeon]|nr:hypothetical protein [Candidatus Woesearchaeota archaeon]